VTLARLPGAASLASEIERFSRLVLEGDPAATTQGARLYELLLGGLDAPAKAKPTWLLSLDAALFDLPFAALVAARDAGGPVYLFERHTLMMIPGIWALERSGDGAWSGGMLALGDPVYNLADRRWTGSARAVVGENVLLPRLAGSGREIRSCRKAWPGEGVLLEGLDADWNQLRSQVRQRHPEVLHLATHYVVSPEHPRQVLLALGLNRLGEWQYVGAEQIAAMRLNSRLVVMSGCGSGDGRTVAGEGRVGLARAWLKSGARAVVATYWRTPDDTGALLESLYRHWRHADPDGSPTRTAAALQMAQREMLRAGSWRAEPRYWASYFLVGKS
jgi:CHAT domain-containing protein